MIMAGEEEEEEEEEILISSNILPHDIILEVLLNLPVKSVGKFRCVSKPWNKILSGKFFIKLHLDRSREKEKIICTDSEYGPCSFYSLDYQETDHLVEVDRPRYMNGVRICSSHDGLLCVEHRESSAIFIWNPSTTYFRRIQIPFNSSFHSCNNYNLYYNHSVDDYQILRICDILWKTESAVYIYSVSKKRKKWKRYPNIKYWIIQSWRKTVKFNGFIHWLAAATNESQRPYVKIILAFEIKTQKFSEVPLPPAFECKNSGVIIEWRNKLGLLRHDSDIFHMWVMDEYGVKDSWRMLVTLEITLGRSIIGSAVLGSTKSGLIVLKLDRNPSHLILYNPVNNNQRINKCFSEIRKEGIDMVGSTYVASLVGFKETRRKRNLKRLEHQH